MNKTERSEFIDEQGHCTQSGICLIHSKVKPAGTELTDEQAKGQRQAKRDVASDLDISVSSVTRIANNWQAMKARRKTLELV